MQKSLKQKMEAQGRYLQRITKGKHTNIKKASSTNIPSKSNGSLISMPSLSEDNSESKLTKECESELEADKTEIEYHEEGTFQPPKRLRVEDGDALSPRHNPAPLDSVSEFYGQSYMFHPEDDTNFQYWIQSLPLPSFL